jgi:hypothetical protein
MGILRGRQLIGDWVVSSCISWINIQSKVLHQSVDLWTFTVIFYGRNRVLHSVKIKDPDIIHLCDKFNLLYPLSTDWCKTFDWIFIREIQLDTTQSPMSCLPRKIPIYEQKNRIITYLAIIIFCIFLFCWDYLNQKWKIYLLKILTFDKIYQKHHFCKIYNFSTK